MLLETLVKYARFAAYGWKIDRIRKRLQKDPANKLYRDLATTRVVDAEGEHLEMFELNDSARAAVDKAKKQAEQRKQRHVAHAHDDEEALHIEAAE